MSPQLLSPNRGLATGRVLRNLPRAGTCLTIAVALGVLLAACSSGGKSASAHYPVTVTSCGSSVTYSKAPTRAVSNGVNTTEDMLVLGLESHMVGTFGVASHAPEGSTPVASHYMAAYQKVDAVSPDNFTLPQLTALHPDFLFAGYGYGLQTGTNLTPASLSKLGIKTLVVAESCALVQATTSVSMNETYDDLVNLGTIFGVKKQAESLVSEMQNRVSKIQGKVSSLPKVTVFDYDSGETAPLTGPGLAMVNAEISLAGGTNIFANLKQTWSTVTWNQVVQADPACIIINNYGTTTATQKEQFLESSPITKNLTAVKNKCFLPLDYDEVTPSPRDVEAVSAIAKWLHPTAFSKS
ncbi:MAG: ABC transporter substrate-binding protein [Acidimicrobiales bacterium]